MEEEVENKTGCVWSTQLHEERSAWSSAHSGRMMVLAINGITSIFEAMGTIIWIYECVESLGGASINR